MGHSLRKPLISMIVAMDKNGLIGVDNRLPWRLPKDMSRFRDVTMGKPVIMGRKTYESIPTQFRPLTGRKNIVLTRQEGFEAPGCLVVHYLEDGIKAAKGSNEVVIIGGAMLYEQCLPNADKLYLTLVDDEFIGDTYFPTLNYNDWIEVFREEHFIDEQHAHDFTFVILRRR